METGQLTYSLSEISKASELLQNLMHKCSIFAFSGDLGAGKTTLVKKLLKDLGVKDVITSPTFAYMCQYQNDKGKIFYHFDLYRMTSAQDFFNAGFAEFLNRPNSWIFIEWPEMLLPYLKEEVCEVSLEHLEEKRLLRYSLNNENNI